MILRPAASSDVTPRAFDVICAGEPSWNIAVRGRVAAVDPARDVRPTGGAMSAALTLARQGLYVGLATVLTDDRLGRALLEKVSAAGVETSGVALAAPTADLVFVDGRGGARDLVGTRDEGEPFTVPPGWTSQVLLVSGMSPVVAHAAAACRAARAARRAGSTVVLDLAARWHIWGGRDARTIAMVLREADVVWCTAEDLFGLNLDIGSLRRLLRHGAVLAVTDGTGVVRAYGPFGEVVHHTDAPARTPIGHGEAFATAICAELTLAGQRAQIDGEMWTRALRRGHHAALSLPAA